MAANEPNTTMPTGKQTRRAPTPDCEPGTNVTAGSGISRRQSLLGAAGLLAAGTAGTLASGLGSPGAADAATGPMVREDLAVAAYASIKVQTFVTRPDLRPPGVTITNYDQENPFSGLPGYIALAPKPIKSNPYVQAGPMIVDTQGRLVWFQPTADNGRITAFNTNVQSYNGSPTLAYWSGDVPDGFGQGTAHIANGDFATIRNISRAAGLKIDLHELNITSRGTVLLTAYSTKSDVDLSALGGARSGTVRIGHALEVNIKSGAVVWQWNSLRHVTVAESYVKPPTAATTPYDYFHINSICELDDGNMLVSSRNCSTLYKIDKQTGAIIWRLNGKRSDFAIASGAGFGWQHHVRQVAANQLTLFDNAAATGLKAGYRSRGLLINFNETTKKVTLARDYAHPAGFISDTMGSVQQLSGGRVLVGWGSQPYFSLFSKTGTLLADGVFPPQINNYRAFMVDWSGRPSRAPAVAVRNGESGGYVVYASWNGVTGIDHWRVLAGTSASNLKQAGWQPWSGFESAIFVNAPGPYFQAVAVDKKNTVLGRSTAIKV